jgi:hypothetical protein
VTPIQGCGRGALTDRTRRQPPTGSPRPEAAPTAPRGASHFQIYSCQDPNGGFVGNLWITLELCTDFVSRDCSHFLGTSGHTEGGILADLALSGFVRCLVAGQSCSSAEISRSRVSCSRAWCPQNSSSPPVASTALTRAAAPQRSQRSAAVNSGRASVVVIGVLPPSRHRLPGATSGHDHAVASVSLVVFVGSTLADAWGSASVPVPLRWCLLEIYPDAAALRSAVVPLGSRYQGIYPRLPAVQRDASHFGPLPGVGSP